MERRIYLSISAMQEVVLSPANNPKLAALVELHSLLFLDIEQAGLEEMEEDIHSILVIYQQKLGTIAYHSRHDWQQNLNTVATTDCAGTVFITENDTSEYESASRDLGVCVVNRNSIQKADFLLQRLVQRELPMHDRRYRNWQETLNGLPIAQVPVNALVVTDTHLFGDRGRFIDIGSSNLISLLQVLLPAELEIDFHLLLVASNRAVPFDETSFANFAQSIEAELGRPYKIQIGLVTRPEGGKERRSIVGNFYFCTSQHGFACFKNFRPDYNNDFNANGPFEGANQHGFDMPAHSMSTELKTAKTLLTNNKTREEAPGCRPDPVRRFLGYYNNRLLSLVP